LEVDKALPLRKSITHERDDSQTLVQWMPLRMVSQKGDASKGMPKVQIEKVERPQTEQTNQGR